MTLILDTVFFNLFSFYKKLSNQYKNKYLKFLSQENQTQVKNINLIYLTILSHLYRATVECLDYRTFIINNKGCFFPLIRIKASISWRIHSQMFHKVVLFKRLVLDSLFEKRVTGWMSATLRKMKNRHRCFPLNFENFSRIFCLQNTSECEIWEDCEH